MNWGSSGENRGTIGWGIAENGWPKWAPHFENLSHCTTLGCYNRRAHPRRPNDLAPFNITTRIHLITAATFSPSHNSGLAFV